MIEKKGYLKNAEARENGFFIKGKKVKGARLTQAQCDEWNGVKKSAPAPKVEEVVESIVEETLVEIAEEEPKAKTIFKRKRKK